MKKLNRLKFLYILKLSVLSLCRGGGIGRHTGLKIPWAYARAGSSPAPGTDWGCSSIGQSAGLSIQRLRVRVPPLSLALLTQLVEFLAFNQGVGGSSPPERTEGIRLYEEPVLKTGGGKTLGG